MNLIKPKSLNKGDTIAIVAPAGNVNRDVFLIGVESLKQIGFNVVYSEDIFLQNRYLAGYDDIKVKELEDYFKNPKIDGILCARGGYGSIRLIKKINYDIIKSNPKFFGGYSDITALQLMFLKNAGLISYTAPMICSDFGQNISEFSMHSFLNACVSKEIECEVLKDGFAKGILWGGNLSTIVSLCGQDFLPDEDFIFFAEDLSEPVYKIDKMLQQLFNIDAFARNIKGIILGEFLDVDNPDWLNNMFLELALELSIPIVKNQNITHSKDKLTLPIGGVVELEGGILKIH